MKKILGYRKIFFADEEKIKFDGPKKHGLETCPAKKIYTFEKSIRERKSIDRERKYEIK